MVTEEPSPPEYQTTLNKVLCGLDPGAVLEFDTPVTEGEFEECATLLSFDGIAILSSNFKENMDSAFTRRFESIIYFPIPRPEDQLRIWRRGFSTKAQLEESVDLDQLARDHVLSGDSVMNVIRFVSLQSLKQGGRAIGYDDLMQRIRREYSKEGKTG